MEMKNNNDNSPRNFHLSIIKVREIIPELQENIEAVMEIKQNGYDLYFKDTQVCDILFEMNKKEYNVKKKKVNHQENSFTSKKGNNKDNTIIGNLNRAKAEDIKKNHENN